MRSSARSKPLSYACRRTPLNGFMRKEAMPLPRWQLRPNNRSRHRIHYTFHRKQGTMRSACSRSRLMCTRSYFRHRQIGSHSSPTRNSSPCRKTTWSDMTYWARRAITVSQLGLIYQIFKALRWTNISIVWVWTAPNLTCRSRRSTRELLLHRDRDHGSSEVVGRSTMKMEAGKLWKRRMRRS